MKSNELLTKLDKASKKDLTVENNQIDFYNLLEKFSMRVVRMNKPLSPEYYEELSTMLAEELYINTSKGLITGYTSSIYSYASKVLKSVVAEWYKINKKLPKERNAPIKYHPDQFGRYATLNIDEALYYTETPEELKELFHKVIKALVSGAFRFDREGVNTNIRKVNLRMSFILSVKYRRFINFRLSETEEKFCRFLYNKFKVEFEKILAEKEATYKISEANYALSCYLDMIMFDPEEEG